VPGDTPGDLQPWIILATKLGYDSLADAMATAMPGEWRKRARDIGSALNPGRAAHPLRKEWQAAFVASIDYWFDLQARPTILEKKST